MTTSNNYLRCYTFENLVSSDEIVEMAMDIVEAQFMGKGPKIYSSDKAKEYLVLKMNGYEREVLACIFLDATHRVIASEELFWGTINQNTVYPREIVKQALVHSAVAVIIAHNHPSGTTEPSQQDIKLTAHLKDALGLVDIRLLDHLIVGGADCLSMADQGFL